MVQVAMIAAGGAIGAALRYVLSEWAQRLADSPFPVGTLVVNVLGCLLIGFLGALLAGQQLLREEYHLTLGVGVLGAFTTFSTFGWETFALANPGFVRLAVWNILLNNVTGIVAVWFGYRIGTKWYGV